MLYLILAVVQSTLIVVLFKLFIRFGINNLQAIVVNYFVASMLGFSLSTGFSGIAEITDQAWLIFAILSGFFLMFVFNIFALSSQKVGVAITAVTSKMSVVIPVVFGFLLYNEPLGILKIIGIICALMAFYLTFKREEKISIKSYYLILPVLLFLGNGTNDTLLNYAERRFLFGDSMYFLSSAFFISLIFGLIFFGIKSCVKPQKIEWKNIAGGTILGLLNLGSTYFFLQALSVFESSVFFPIFNVSIVALAALIGYFVFKETLRRINWLGILLAALAIIIMAMV